MTTHEVLVAARNLIERGWVRGGSGSWTATDRCALGQLGAATGLRGEDLVAFSVTRHGDPAASEAAALLERLTGSKWLAVWNDEPCRTKADVLALFDEAIAATAPEPDVDFLNRASFRQPEAVA